MTLRLMPAAVLALLLGTLASASRGGPSGNGHGSPSTLNVKGWELEYVENFSCKQHSCVDSQPVDGSVWEHQLGNGAEYGIVGWGNGEPQFYTDGLNNSGVVREAGAEDGCALHISVLRGPAPFAYTSAKLRAKPDGPLGAIQPTPPANGQPSRGVRVAGRIALPQGTTSGVWPALWLLPNLPNGYGGWAASGEIDIMETSDKMTIQRATIHYGGNWPDNVYTGGELIFDAASPPSGPEYHVWSVLWWHEKMEFYIDDMLIYKVDQATWNTTAVSKAENPAAPFDKPFAVILNIAAGGWNWAGYPPDDAVFPQRMMVDYVSVHREEL